MWGFTICFAYRGQKNTDTYVWLETVSINKHYYHQLLLLMTKWIISVTYLNIGTDHRTAPALYRNHSKQPLVLLCSRTGCTLRQILCSDSGWVTEELSRGCLSGWFTKPRWKTVQQDSLEFQKTYKTRQTSPSYNNSYWHAHHQKTKTFILAWRPVLFTWNLYEVFD